MAVVASTACTAGVTSTTQDTESVFGNTACVLGHGGDVHGMGRVVEVVVREMLLVQSSIIEHVLLII